MGSELNDLPEPKDRTKLMWGAVLVLVAVMSVAIWWSGKTSSNTSVVRLKHILIAVKPGDTADDARARELIRDLRERIVKGADFGDIAEEYSNDPQSAARGGDIGYVQMGSLDPAIEVYAWTAPIGKLSPVLKSGYGYHLVIVTDRHISDVDRLKMEKDREWKSQASGGNDTGADSGGTAESSGSTANQ